MLSIDRYTESASRNREFFLNRPHSIGPSRKFRKAHVSRLSYHPKMDDPATRRSLSDLMLPLSLLILLATLLTGCSNEPEYSDQQRACIMKLYSSYDAKQMSQCVNVCKSCMGGSTVTCTTSCNLKGAR